jgi:hypothetical protein
MNVDDVRSGRSPSDRGGVLERGMFERIREWNDVFPWFRLARSLRLAGSPTMVLISLAALGLWWWGQTWILGRDLDATTLSEIDRGFVVGWQPLESIARALRTSPSMIHLLPSGTDGWMWLLGTAWTLLIWTPLALMLTRQGALLTAGRPMMGLRQVMQLAVTRTPRSWLASIIPSVCVAAIGLMIFLAGKLCQYVSGIDAIANLAALMLAMLAIAGGLLAFGSHFAIPLGIAAIANEQDPDPLDSLSRGYEYLMRRPLHLAAYIALSLVMIAIVGLIAAGAAHAAISVATLALGDSIGEQEHGSATLAQRVVTLLSWFPLAVAVTLFWGLVGGVYLLLRWHAGGQEVEDVWTEPLRSSPPLPSLPMK